jgi:hypothetical protein
MLCITYLSRLSTDLLWAVWAIDSVAFFTSKECDFFAHQASYVWSLSNSSVDPAIFQNDWPWIVSIPVLASFRTNFWIQIYLSCPSSTWVCITRVVSTHWAMILQSQHMSLNSATMAAFPLLHQSIRCYIAWSGLSWHFCMQSDISLSGVFLCDYCTSWYCFRVWLYSFWCFLTHSGSGLFYELVDLVTADNTSANWPAPNVSLCL